MKKLLLSIWLFSCLATVSQAQRFVSPLLGPKPQPVPPLAKVASAAGMEGVIPGNQIQALWDIRVQLDPMTLSGISPALAGIVYAKGIYFCSQWNTTDAFVLVDSLGQWVGNITITGVGAVRGMTYDGTFIYAANNTGSIQVINPTTRTRVRAFSVPSALGTIRWITYNPTGNGGLGSFYVGNYATDIAQINKPAGSTATQLGGTITAATHGLTGMYGVVYDYANGGGFWAFDQGQAASGSVLVQLNSSGVQTGITHDVEADLSVTGSSAGGVYIAPSLPGFSTPTLLALAQGAELTGYEITSNSIDAAADSINLDNYLVAWPKSINYSVKIGTRVANLGSSTLTNLACKVETRNANTEALVQTFSGSLASLASGARSVLTTPVLTNNLYQANTIYRGDGLTLASQDQDPDNDTAFCFFTISDSTLARDYGFFDPALTSSIGIGAEASTNKQMGSKYTLPAADTLTSVTILLKTPFAGQQSSVSVYSMTTGNVIGTTALRTTGVYTATADDETNGVLVTFPISPPLILPAGNFFVAVNELGDSTAGLGRHPSVYVPNAFFVRWSTFSSGAWTDVGSFGSTFMDAFSIYPNFGNRKSSVTVSLPTVTTTVPTAITTTTANVGGNASSAGGGAISAKGVVWSTSPAPTIALTTKINSGTGTGSFSTGLTGLVPGTTYHMRAYATNQAGTAYGEERVFTTLASSTNVLSVTFRVDADDYVNAGGILDNGVMSIAGNFTIRGGDLPDWTPAAGAMIPVGNNVYSKSVTFQGPSVSADSLMWKYVKGDEWSDGDEGMDWQEPLPVNCIKVSDNRNRKFLLPPSGVLIISSKLAECPTIESTPFIATNPITGITQTGAVSGGTISSNGGYDVTVRGVCWSTSPNPTTALTTKTIDGSSSTYISNITGLVANTLYYVRAYATNALGTAYGQEIQFTTLGAATVPTVTTNAASAITQTTATSGGVVVLDGGASVTARGVCWSTTANPTIALATKTNDGPGVGAFTSSITGLTPNTLYHVRAYATNSAGTGYGVDSTFTTNALNVVLASLATNVVTNITESSATSGGQISSNGGGAITAKGVVWSTNPNPTVDLTTKTNDGTGSANFISNITNLLEGTQYYVRAYATNSAGTAYGNERSFTTSIVVLVPTLQTTALSNIGPVSATSGGQISSDGGAPVTARGVCWSTTPNPTIALTTKTNDGAGTGSFTSQIAGLSPNTQYYVAAYATNSAGTAYGTVRQFTTTACEFLGAITGAGSVLTCTSPTATLSVSGGTTYTWSTGATGSTLAVSPATTTTYFVYSDGTLGCRDTAFVTVNVDKQAPPAPSISGPATVCQGSSAVLSSSAASGNVWYLNGNPVSTSATYTANTGGTYRVRVTNPINGCYTESSDFNFSVLPRPGITQQPANQVVSSGETATFTVSTAATNPTYRWQVQVGTDFFDLNNTGQFGGVTTNMLTVTNCNVALNNGQLFRCLVGLSSCIDSSGTALLTVVTGVGSSVNQARITLVPNPGTGLFVVNGAADGDAFQLFDNLGKLVHSQNLKTGQAVDVRTLPAGLYHWRLTNRSSSATGSLIKE